MTAATPVATAPGVETPVGLSRRVLLVLAVLVALPALWQVGILVQIFAARNSYPLDFDWSESGALYQAHQLTQGQSMYPDPSSGPLPLPYPPGHFALLAVVGSIVGLDYGTGRLVSVAFFALACAVLAREVVREWDCGLRSVDLAAGLVAVGSIAVTYAAAEGWYDQVRNDSMAVGLAVVAGSLCTRAAPTRRTAVAAGVLFALSVMTKQTMVAYALWAATWFLLFRRREAAAFATALVGTVAVLVVALQLATHGWFWHHTVSTFVGDEVVTARLGSAIDRVATGAPLVLVVPILGLLALARQALTPRAALWLGMVAVAVPANLSSYLKAGGSANSLMPVLVLGGPVAMVLLAAVARSYRRWTPVVALAALTVVTLVVASRPMHADYFTPTDQERDDARQVNAFVASLDGGVLAPSQPFLVVRNGDETPQMHAMGLLDASDMQGDAEGLSYEWLTSGSAGRGRDGDIPWGRLRAFVERTRPRWIILGSVVDVVGAESWMPPEYVRVADAPSGSKLAMGTGPYHVYERTGP